MAASTIGLGREAKWLGTSDLNHAEVTVIINRSLPNFWRLAFGRANTRFDATVTTSTAKGRKKGDPATVSRQGNVSFI